MRRSHEGLEGIFKDDYFDLPDDLKEFSYYYNDNETGHVIMAIPKCLLEEADKNGDLDIFECPFPTRYVLAKGYYVYKNHIICDGEYDPILGLRIDEKWYEV